MGDRASHTCGKFHSQHCCFSRLDDAWRAEFGDEAKSPRWAELLRSGVDIFALGYDAILAAMYALSVSAEGDCYLCVPPGLGIEAAALGASESALPGTTPAEALHTYTLDSGASRCFFRDSTTLTPLTAPIPVKRADPSGGPVLARSSTVLPCPAVPSGSLSNLHLPSFSTKLVSYAPLQDAMVTTTTPGGVCVTSGSSPLLMSPPVSPDSPVTAPPWSPLPATPSWHALLPPRSLPSLPPSLAPPCLPCVEGQQRAAPHSSSFRPTTAPLQTLHMDAWGPARISGQGRERYFLLVVDEYMCNTTVFLLRSKGELNLWPRISLPETSPTLRWTGKVGDASVFRVWGSRAFVRDTSADKLSSRAIPCVFLGFPPEAPGWQFYHPTLHCVLPSQDVTFDESVPFYRSSSLRCVSGRPTLQDCACRGRCRLRCCMGAASGGAASWGAEPESAEPGGAKPEGAEPGGAESEGVESGGAELGGAEPEGVEPGGAESEGAESGGAEPRGTSSGGGPAGASPPAGAGGFAARGTGAGGAGAVSLGGAGVTAGARGTRGAGAAGRGGARTRDAGAGGAGAGDSDAGDTGAGGTGAGGIGAGDTSTGGIGAGGVGVGGTGPGGAGARGADARRPGARGTGAGGAGVGGAGAGSTSAGGTVQRRPFFVPPPPSSLPPPHLLQPDSPLPAPSPYAEQTDLFTQHREPASCPASPVCAVRTSLLNWTITPRPPTPSVPLTKLLDRRGLTGTRLLLALATTKASTLRGCISTSTTAAVTTTTAAAASTTAAAASTTSAAASTTSAAATKAPTRGTTPTSTTTPSASSTAFAAAPAVPSTTLASLALAVAAPPTRGRRSSDLLSANKVDSSSRSNRGEKGDRGTPLKERGATVAARSTYS
ncbi:unnamed protein product [Closterium sp. NIES-53]